MVDTWKDQKLVLKKEFTNHNISNRKKIKNMKMIDIKQKMIEEKNGHITKNMIQIITESDDNIYS